MKALLDAFIARLTYWLTPKPYVEPAPAPLLKPGKCQCGHRRCDHYNGKDACGMTFGPNDEFPRGSRCACEIYIPKRDDPSDEPPTGPPTPSAEELERMMRL